MSNTAGEARDVLQPLGVPELGLEAVDFALDAVAPDALVDLGQRASDRPTEPAQPVHEDAVGRPAAKQVNLRRRLRLAKKGDDWQVRLGRVQAPDKFLRRRGADGAAQNDIHGAPTHRLLEGGDGRDDLGPKPVGLETTRDRVTGFRRGRGVNDPGTGTHH